MGYDDKPFNVFPLPQEWARERTTDGMYKRMFEKLPFYIKNPNFNETIKPGETIALAIGTRYPVPAEKRWVVPNELFVHTNGEIAPTCDFPTFDWQMNQDPQSNTDIALGLKLHMEGRCVIIPCGLISYPGR